MKTITYNIYNIDELKVVNKEGYDKAIDNERDDFADGEMQLRYDEFLNSLKAIADILGIEITGYQLGVGAMNYVDINNDAYQERGNADKNRTVAEVNNIIRRGEQYMLTGTWADSYFHDYFKQHKVEHVTFNDLHKHYEAMIDYMVSAFAKDMEDDYINDNLHHEIAQEQDRMYFADGTIYQAIEVA